METLRQEAEEERNPVKLTTLGRTGSSVSLRNKTENLSRYGLEPGGKYTTHKVGELSTWVLIPRLTSFSHSM